MKCKHCKKNTAFELFCSPECALLYKKISENVYQPEPTKIINKPKKTYNSGCGCMK
jgi:hypothetical protein